MSQSVTHKRSSRRSKKKRKPNQEIPLTREIPDRPRLTSRVLPAVSQADRWQTNAPGFTLDLKYIFLLFSRLIYRRIYKHTFTRYHFYKITYPLIKEKLKNCKKIEREKKEFKTGWSIHNGLCKTHSHGKHATVMALIRPEQGHENPHGVRECAL